MATATHRVSVLLHGRFKVTSAITFFPRLRVADDMTKCFSVCFQPRSYKGSYAISLTVCPRLLLTPKLHVIRFTCDNKLRYCLYSSGNRFFPQVMSVVPYSSQTDISKRKGTTKPVLPGKDADIIPDLAEKENTTKFQKDPIAQPDPLEKGAKSQALDKTTEVATSVTADTEKTEAKPAVESMQEEQLTLFQRFKKAYKEHGKVLVAVHVATSIVWFGSFYTAARSGLDIVPLMESWNLSETIIKPFRAGGLGDIAVAYLMYKLATPARYTVTLAGTNFAIRYLRHTGKMAPKSEEDSIRQLVKEGRQKLKHSQLRLERLQRVQTLRKKKVQEGKKAEAGVSSRKMGMGKKREASDTEKY